MLGYHVSHAIGYEAVTGRAFSLCYIEHGLTVRIPHEHTEMDYQVVEL